MLDNEIRLTVVDPDPEAEPGKIRVASLERGCSVQQMPVIGEGPASPVVAADVAAATRMQLSPAAHYQRIFREAKNPRVDPACAAARPDGGDGRERFDGLWFVEPRDDRLSGCGLDIAMEHGLLHDSRNVSRTEQNGWIEMRTRPIFAWTKSSGN
jgi:hypothetical protein